MTPLQWSAHWVAAHRLGWRSGSVLRDVADLAARRLGFALVPLWELRELAEHVEAECTPTTGGKA